MKNYKISAKLKGVKKSEAHTLSLKHALTGNSNSSGKRSEATKDHMRKLRAQRTQPMTGKTHSTETRAKMSASAKKSAHNRTQHFGYTNIEKKLYNQLDIMDITYIKQHSIGYYIVDAYIPALNTVIEVDGEYWHSLDRVVVKDKRENTYLTTRGYNLIRIPGKQVLSENFNIQTYVQL